MEKADSITGLKR